MISLKSEDSVCSQVAVNKRNNVMNWLFSLSHNRSDYETSYYYRFVVVTCKKGEKIREELTISLFSSWHWVVACEIGILAVNCKKKRQYIQEVT